MFPICEYLTEDQSKKEIIRHDNAHCTQPGSLHRSIHPNHSMNHSLPLHLPLPVPWPNQLHIPVRQFNAKDFCYNVHCILKCSPTSSLWIVPKSRVEPAFSQSWTYELSTTSFAFGKATSERQPSSPPLDTMSTISCHMGCPAPHLSSRTS